MTTDLDQGEIDRGVAAASFEMSRRRWKRFLEELARRGEARRESGAFLLADRDGRQVRAVAYYDDLDAHCLTGGIRFASSGFTELWRICEQRGLKVVGDVHTHPGPWVMQSDIDATNPMIARVGHVAIIVPNYGRAVPVAGCGIHIYLGSRRWIHVAAEDAGTVLHVYGVLTRAQMREWAAMMGRFLGRRHGVRR